MAGLLVGVAAVLSRSKLFTVTGEPMAQPVTGVLVVQEVKFVPLVVAFSEVLASLSDNVYVHSAPLPGATVVWVKRL
jgi:hypothetical protein